VSGVSETPALELRDIDMHYGYVRALDGIDVAVRQGEVLGLLGDNGAGKSTLLKVMSGAHQPTSGTILVRGAPVVFHSPSDSTRAGIEMVYQDLALVDAQDIATNLNIGREILRRGPLGWLGFVDHKAQRKRSAAELDRLGVRTAAMTRPVEMLSGGQRQVVALARAASRVIGGVPGPPGEASRAGLAGGAPGPPGEASRAGLAGGVLLLDEPTAALGYEQTRQVQALTRRMAENGVACVLVTHNLPLAIDVCDRIVVLNRGRKVADVATSATDNDQLVGWITGARASMFA